MKIDASIYSQLQHSIVMGYGLALQLVNRTTLAFFDGASIVSSSPRRIISIQLTTSVPRALYDRVDVWGNARELKAEVLISQIHTATSHLQSSLLYLVPNASVVRLYPPTVATRATSVDRDTNIALLVVISCSAGTVLLILIVVVWFICKSRKGHHRGYATDPSEISVTTAVQMETIVEE